ncbi:hypothetical protein [Streptomyces sp. NPDC054784]
MAARVRAPGEGRVRARGRTAGLLAGACLVAVAPFLAGCSDDGGDGDTAKDGAKGTRSSQSPTASEPAPDASSPDTPDAPKGGTGPASTAKQAITRWVTAVVQDRPDDACAVMIAMSPGDAPAPEKPSPDAVGTCGTTPAAAAKGKEQLSDMHTAFTPKNPGDPPRVSVHGPGPSGGALKVGGDHIDVDGQSLTDVILGNSTGLEKGQVAVDLTATRVGGSWYVSDLGFSIG